jgi:hypothetical protein
MPTFLTVKEAATLVGKSPSSVRRLIYPILHEANHPDRVHIEPNDDEARELRLKGENFAWRVSEELLRRQIPAETIPEKDAGTFPSRDHGNSDGDLLAMLRRELDIKNNQITQQSELISKQMELISGLSERLREGNILIGSLQQQLALPDGKGTAKSDPVESETAPTQPREKTTKATTKTAKLKPKRGFLSRLFR